MNRNTELNYHPIISPHSSSHHKYYQSHTLIPSPIPFQHTIHFYSSLPHPYPPPNSSTHFLYQHKNHTHNNNNLSHPPFTHSHPINIPPITNIYYLQSFSTKPFLQIPFTTFPFYPHTPQFLSSTKTPPPPSIKINPIPYYI